MNKEIEYPFRQMTRLLARMVLNDSRRRILLLQNGCARLFPKPGADFVTATTVVLRENLAKEHQ